jgi:hypothetical protein
MTPRSNYGRANGPLAAAMIQYPNILPDGRSVPGRSAAE